MFKQGHILLGNVSITTTNWYFSAHFLFFFYCFAFDCCRFCVVIRVFHPRHNGQWPPTLKDFLSQSQYFHFLWSVVNKGTTWYHLYNVFGMTQSLTGDWTRDHTRCQHYATRLSRRWCFLLCSYLYYNPIIKSQ